MKNSGAFHVDGLRFLDVPDYIAKGAGDDFFEIYNKKFLDKAIERGDAIRLISDPKDVNNIFKNGKDAKGGLTTFGKEIEYLERKGFEINGSQAIKRQ